MPKDWDPTFLSRSHSVRQGSHIEAWPEICWALAVLPPEHLLGSWRYKSNPIPMPS